MFYAISVFAPTGRCTESSTPEDRIRAATKRLDGIRDRKVFFQTLESGQYDDVSALMLCGACGGMPYAQTRAAVRDATATRLPDVLADLTASFLRCEPCGGTGLKEGFDVNMTAEFYSRNHEGETPLHIAVANGDIKIAELFLSYGCDVNAKGISKSVHDGWRKGFTPLHYAVNNGRTDIVEFLLRNGARIDVSARKLRVSNHGDATVDVTPLLCTIVNHDLDTLRYLVEKHGADIKWQDKGNGVTFLHVLAQCGMNGLKVRLSDKNWTDVARCPSCPPGTALCDECSASHAELVRFLVANGPDIDARTQGMAMNFHETAIEIYLWQAETALQMASYEGNLETVRILLELGAGIEAKCQRGNAPLIFAVIGLEPEVRQTLLEAGLQFGCVLRSGNGHTNSEVVFRLVPQ